MIQYSKAKKQALQALEASGFPERGHLEHFDPVKKVLHFSASTIKGQSRPQAHAIACLQTGEILDLVVFH